MRRLWAVLVLICLASSPLIGCSRGGGTVTWNYLVYMDGDNNMEPYGIIDLNEMELIGSTPFVNILVLLDRNPGYDTSNGDWPWSRLYLVTRDSDPASINSAVLWDLVELDMSHPSTLQNFVTYCQQRFPAQRTILTLWNHGGGVYPKTRGVCWDDTTGTNPSDCLTLAEVAAALSGARAATGRKIDLINLNVCLTQMLEVAYEWRNDADYLVGSEAVAWSTTNNYVHVLSQLRDQPAMTVDQFARFLVDDYYYVVTSYWPSLTATYSALSLGAGFAALMNSFTQFATALRYTPNLGEVVTAWNNTTSFHYAPVNAWHEFRDLYDFADETTRYVSDGSVSTPAAGLKNAIVQAVIHRRETGPFTGSTPAYGLSILIPSNTEWQNYRTDYPTLALSAHTDWDEFIGRLP